MAPGALRFDVARRSTSRISNLERRAKSREIRTDSSFETTIGPGTNPSPAIVATRRIARRSKQRPRSIVDLQTIVSRSKCAQRLSVVNPVAHPAVESNRRDRNSRRETVPAPYFASGRHVSHKGVSTQSRSVRFRTGSTSQFAANSLRIGRRRRVTAQRDRGRMVADLDLLIAATAKAHRLVVAATNARHVNLLEELVVKDWSQ